MKKIISSFIIATTVYATSFGSNNNVNETIMKAWVQSIPDSTPANAIISGYLQLKNALVNENGKDAATAGKAIVAALAKMNSNTFTDDQKKVYNDIAEDLKENAEHIGANQDKIAHQREHFVMLSKLMEGFVKVFGNGGQTLYKDFCPMANDGKGAIWISEIKEIKNPYYGKRMLTCGSVKATMQ